MPVAGQALASFAGRRKYSPHRLRDGSVPTMPVIVVVPNESTYLHHLWASFTGDQEAAPFAAWAPYVAATSRPGIAASSSSFYRAASESSEQVKSLVVHKLELPVLTIAGEKAIGLNHEALVRAFATNLHGNAILPGAGHFLAEERPNEVAAALRAFLAET